MDIILRLLKKKEFNLFQNESKCWILDFESNVQPANNAAKHYTSESTALSSRGSALGLSNNQVLPLKELTIVGIRWR